MTYLLIKWVHILSATLLFGTGLGSAFYKYMADRRGDVAAIAFVSRHVVLADWWFTTPTVILQPVTGFALALIAGYPLTRPWMAASIGLYVVAGLCWLPVVWFQIRMRDLAAEAREQNTSLPEAYWRYARIWFWLGVPAFCAMVAVFGLMVLKPG